MVFGWLIRFVVVMLLVRLAWKFVSGFAQGATRRPVSGPARGMPLVQDPVCGTYVDQGRAVTARRKGTVHHFCSDDCRKAFLEGDVSSA
tara:strand:- start:213 stop:479 length:267 start_codon:yes stop_codon:yes gene_type:complete